MKKTISHLGDTCVSKHLSGVRTAVLGAILTLVAAATLSAQSTGGVQGTVIDATGASVANATVTVTNQGTGESHALKTDNAGLYSEPSLIPGTYSVRAESPGMQTAVANQVVVSVSTVQRQDFTLNVGSTTSTVEIQSTPPVVESESVSVGSVVNQRTVQEIPLNGRHFVDLALLIPGSVTPPQNGSLTSPLRGQGSFSFNSGGARETAVNFMINGIQISDISQNQITLQPTINTVEEFKIDNSTYSAEYGRNSGAIVNIATRSGTNSVHGEVYEFIRNSAFDARNFGNPTGVQQSPFKRNQFGADGGAPIKKDKTFIFLSYEQLIQRQSVPLTAPVLSAAQRAAIGTYDSAVQKLIPLIPLANSPGNVFISSASAPVNIYQGTADFTQQFSTANRLNAYYVMQHDLRSEPPTTDGNTLPGFGDNRQGWRQLLALNDSHVFSPSLVNEARAGFNRIHIVFAAQNTLNAADYGIASGVNTAIGLPQIEIAGDTTAFGGISGFPQGRGDDTITLSDTLNWVRGKHSIKFGPEYYHSIADSFSYTPGLFTFPSIATFLTDQPNGFSGNNSNRASRIYGNSIGAFVQDSWKATQNLTLDLGLRYDWNGTPSEAEDRFVIFNPVLDTLQQVGKNGGPSHAYNESALNFEPRVGFAWDPFGTGRTVVRSAYAIFIDQPNNGIVSGLASNPPFAFPVSSTSTSLSLLNAIGIAGGSVSPVSVAQNYKDAYVQSWNFNIQQQFANNFGLMVGYFGNKGTDLNIERNYNQFVNGVRPYPKLSASSAIDPGLPLTNITVNESDGNSSYNALWLTVKKQFAKGLQFDTSYTWSKSIDENSRDFEGVVVQDSNNIRGDRGLSDFDARNRFVFSGIYDLPFHGNRLVEGWEFTIIEQIQSGNPINFHTTTSTFTGNANLRPNVTGELITAFTPATNRNASYVTYIQDPGVLVNQGSAFGNLGRNVIIGPGFSNLDLAMVKNTKISERLTWQIRADAFDLLNQANFGQPGSTIGSSTLGLITGTRFPPGDSGSSRQLQLAMKLTF